MRSIVSCFGARASVLALALTLAAASAAAQIAGLSTSNVHISDLTNNGNNTNSCGHLSTPSSLTNEATSAVLGCGPIVGGSASATASSSNALRTASAAATANQTGTQGQTLGYGQSYSTQYSQLTVTGTPSPTDNLIFHFVTSQSATGNVNSNSGYGFWNLVVSGGTNNPVFAQQTAGVGLLTVGAAQTAQGFDFTMPFTPTGALFQYNFTVDAQGYITGHATGNTTQTGSISATLAGIDAVDGSGALISSASFDQRGFGAINAVPSVGPPPSTVPEPSSIALLATGLVALIPATRRRLTR